MTTYYVRKMGSGGPGTDPEHAFVTIADALAVVGPGDTIYIGAGWYGEFWPDLSVSGTPAQPIRVIGDVTGTHTGDAGPVVVAHTRWWLHVSIGHDPLIRLRNPQHVHFENLVFLGNSYFSTPAFTVSASTTLEGLRFGGCVFYSAMGRAAMAMEFASEYTPPASPAFVFDGCLIWGYVMIRFPIDVRLIDLQSSFVNSILVGSTESASVEIRGDGTGTTTLNGIDFVHCTFWGSYEAVVLRDIVNTTHQTRLANSWHLGGTYMGLLRAGATPAAAIANLGHNVGSGDRYESSTVQATDMLRTQPVLVGGLHDHLYYKHYGMSPYRLFEPIALGSPPLIAAGHNAVPHATVDAYGTPRPAHARRIRLVSYLGNTTYGANWSSVAALRTIDTWSGAYCQQIGDEETNTLVLEDLWRCPIQPDHTIYHVRARVFYYGNNAGVAGHVRFYTDNRGETLADLPLPPVLSAERVHYADCDLAEPAGGWTLEALQTLEARCWNTTGNNILLYISLVQIWAEVHGGLTVGAVESRLQPVTDVSERFDNTDSIRFDGPGFYETWKPVIANAVTVSVFVHVDDAYSGEWPLLEVFNLPGGLPDIQVAASAVCRDDDYEELVATFTAPAMGFVRVRLRSRDASATGRCWFDNLTVVSGNPRVAPPAMLPQPAAQPTAPESGELSPLFPAPPLARLNGPGAFLTRRVVDAGVWRLAVRCHLAGGFTGDPPHVTAEANGLVWEAEPPVTQGTFVYYRLRGRVAASGEVLVRIQGRGRTRDDVTWIEQIEVEPA